MEKVKLHVLLGALLLLRPFVHFSQDTEIVRPGLVRAMATLSPSYLMSNKQTYFYLHGNIEGFLTRSISMVGEGFGYLGNQTTTSSEIAYNHSLFFGASKHVINNQHDAYLGVQPGISMTKMDASTTNLPSTRLGVNPLISVVVGYNFYVNSVFHFFVQTRIIGGQHVYDKVLNLAEIRLSAGLGFHINTIRQR